MTGKERAWARSDCIWVLSRTSSFLVVRIEKLLPVPLGEASCTLICETTYESWASKLLKSGIAIGGPNSGKLNGFTLKGVPSVAGITNAGALRELL